MFLGNCLATTHAHFEVEVVEGWLAKALALRGKTVSLNLGHEPKPHAKISATISGNKQFIRKTCNPLSCNNGLSGPVNCHKVQKNP